MPQSSAFEHLSPAFPGRAAWGTAARLRAWQVEALQRYRDLSRQDFLAVATPGAGKTTFALRVAGDLLESRVVEQLVVGAATGFGTKGGDGDVGEEVPVGVQASGLLVEEGEPREVRGAGGPGEDLRVHGPAQVVGEQQVAATVGDDRRSVAHRVEHPLEAGPGDPVRVAAAPPPGPGRRPVSGLREVVQVLAFRGVELERSRDRIEHAAGHARQVAALELGVVLDADASQRGHLAAAQARHPPVPVDGEPQRLRGDLGATCTQEVAHLCPDVHEGHVRPRDDLVGPPAGTPQRGPPRAMEG